MTKEQRYWDSSAFLGWLNKEPETFDVCDQILADAEAGKCQIVTSTVTFAEVFWVKPTPRAGTLPTADQIRAIKDLFGKSFVIPAELDRLTALLARDLLFTFAQSYGLKPMDALHLATAIKSRSRGDVECFDTWDEPLGKLNGQLVKVEQLQDKGSGADLYIGIPPISKRLPFTEPPTGSQS
jgi:predicted nucleic acid-binding protein